MKIKSLQTIVISLFVLSTLPSKAQVPAGLQVKLQDTLNHMAMLYNFKGLSASVSYKTSGVWNSAVGLSSVSSMLNIDHLIGIGSNTKTFVAAIMLQLVQSNKVNLNDTIGTWVGGKANINGQITIKQILNHTSGIANYTDNTVFWDSVNLDLNRLWTKTEILNKFVNPPLFTPGASWSYCNTNYLIAGYIEEQILGKPIQTIIRDSIIMPLGLTHTSFPPYETSTYQYAEVYTNFGAGYSFYFFPYNLNSVADAAGALVSNPADITKFWRALMNGQIIQKSTLQNEMMQWVIISSTFSYGLGVMKERYFGNTVFSHGGTWIGQINSNLCDTTRDIYIDVLSNQDSLGNSFTDKVVAALYRVCLDYLPTSLNDISVYNGFNIYPNPANEYFIIQDKEMKLTSISIYTNIGTLAYHQKITDHQMYIQINTKNLASGMYNLVVNTTTEKYNSKLVINH